MATKRHNNYFSREQSTSSRSWLTTIVYIVIFACLIILTCWLWFKITNPRTLPFKHVKIVGNYNHIRPDVIKAVVRENLSGGFFSFRVNKLKKQLFSLPWVASVSFRRIWPDTLVITIQEQKAIARWGTSQIVNDNGEIFTPSKQSIPMQLPLLLGPSSSKNEILDEFHRFSQLLSFINLTIVQLELNNRQAWQVRLSNGIKLVLGRNDVDKRVANFVRLYPKVIGKRWQQVDYVDLRYQDGLAVRWKHRYGN